MQRVRIPNEIKEQTIANYKQISYRAMSL